MAPSQCMVVKAGEKKAKATEYVWTNRVPERAGLYVSLHDYKEKMTLSEYWEKIYEAGRTGMLPPDEMLEYEYTYKKRFIQYERYRTCNKGSKKQAHEGKIDSVD